MTVLEDTALDATDVVKGGTFDLVALNEAQTEKKIDLKRTGWLTSPPNHSRETSKSQDCGAGAGWCSKSPKDFDLTNP